MDGNLLVEDDLPAEPDENDENEIVLEIGVRHLALTEHQKAMLKPPEDRLAEIQFPKSLQDRGKHKRKVRRKSKWASKFKHLFTGKSSKKWAQRLKQDGGNEELEQEAQGTAKVQQKPSSNGETSRKRKMGMGEKLARASQKKLKQDQTARRFENRRQKRNPPRGSEPLELVAESPWHYQRVRVVNEGLHEGKRGTVTSVRVFAGSEPARYRLQVADESGKRTVQILVDSDEVVIEDPEWKAPKPYKLDWRSVHPRLALRIKPPYPKTIAKP